MRLTREQRRKRYAKQCGEWAALAGTLEQTPPTRQEVADAARELENPTERKQPDLLDKQP